MTALAEGAGTIDITFADAIGTDASGGPIDGATPGASLSYAVAVPEPSAALAVVTGLGLLSARRRRANATT